MNLFDQENPKRNSACSNDSPDGFCFPPVYVSAQLETLIPVDAQRRDLLTELLNRFRKKDYGKITSFEYVDNIAQRHIFFTNTWMHARYETEFGVICLELLYDMALFYPNEEKIDALRQTQSEKDKANAGEGWRF